MTQPRGLCDQQAKNKVANIERALGVLLPDCATVTATHDGDILATQTDALGTRLVVEINKKGEVFRSTSCGENTRGMPSYQKNYDGSIETVPFCRDHNLVRQSGSVSPDKLARAKELILGADKPKVK